MERKYKRTYVAPQCHVADMVLDVNILKGSDDSTLVIPVNNDNVIVEGYADSKGRVVFEDDEDIVIVNTTDNYWDY